MRYALAVLLMLSAALVGQDTKARTSQPIQSGRYQIVLYQGELPPRLNTYLLDTQTGKTWMMKALPDGEDFWEPVLKVDSDEEEIVLLRKHQRPKSSDTQPAK